MEEFERVDDATQKRDLWSGLALTSEASLVVIYGVQLGRRYPLLRTVTIGRERGNDIVLDAADVSRRHATLRRVGDQWRLADMGSTNGTEINGRHIEQETTLDNGDLVNVGGVIFKYIAGGNVESLFHEEIYRMTVYDGLTRLHNKRFLYDFLEREMARSKRHHRPLAVAMIDVDHFKVINDTHGHLAGDHLLSCLADLLMRNVRREELLARYGGEEFLLVLPEADASDAHGACEKVRSIVEQEPFSFGEDIRQVTVSIGYAHFEKDMSRDDLIGAADDQLYHAKRSGRNCVHPGNGHHPQN